jgi:hypothetical protein
VTLTYEGSYAGDHTAGFLQGDATTGFFLADTSISFCSAGVYDPAEMQDYASTELGLKGQDASAFADTHADYVQITTPMLPAYDPYWPLVASPSLKDEEVNYDHCLSWFGSTATEPFLTTRDLKITAASSSRLDVELRTPQPVGPTLDHLKQCFPEAQTYRLRSGSHWVLLHNGFFRHDVISDNNGSCVRSCNPLTKWGKGRVFEISSTTCRGPLAADMQGAADALNQRVGCAQPGEMACVYDQGAGDGKTDSSVQLGTPAAKCIFNGLNDRFALYRGRQPSVRDAVFTWQSTGGFTPEAMSLAAVSTVVSPQSMLYLPTPEEMAVVDGASQGLSLFSLDTFGVVSPSPFY